MDAHGETKDSWYLTLSAPGVWLRVFATFPGGLLDCASRRGTLPVGGLYVPLLIYADIRLNYYRSGKHHMLNLISDYRLKNRLRQRFNAS